MMASGTLTTHLRAQSTLSTSVTVLSQNLSGMSYYSTAQPFLDVMKYAATWITRNSVSQGGHDAWDTGFESNIPTDNNGWPTTIPFVAPNVTNGQIDPNNPGDFLSSNQCVHTLVRVLIPGSYRVRFLGTGSFQIAGPSSPSSSWTQTFTSSNIAALPVDSNGKSYFDTPNVVLGTDGNNVPTAYLYLNINQSSGTNYLHNIEIVTPSYATTNLTNNPFNPAYLNTLNGFNTLRMMDWGAINNSTFSQWSNRTLPTTYTQSQANGVSLEYMIMICNLLGENLWLNIPHMAGQNYVQNAANLILYGAKADGTSFNPTKDKRQLLIWPPLNSDLKVYLEYSNETWNSGFQQAAYVISEATNLRSLGMPFSSDNYTAGEQFAAYQSANIWNWFYQVWRASAPQRLVRVMAGLMNPDYCAIRLATFGNTGIVTTGQKPDALAIAPYFGTSVADNIINNGQLTTATTADILNACSNDIITNVLPTVSAIESIAEQYNVWLNCYEAGQSLVGTYGNLYNTNLTSLLITANRDPGMGSLYSMYFNGLSNAGVVEINNFDDILEPTQYGSWGALEYLTQPLESAYKYQTLVSWMQNNQKNAANLPPTISVSYPSSIVLNNNNGTLPVTLSASGSVDYDDTITSTTWTILGVTHKAQTITVSLPLGVNSITVSVTNSHGATSSSTISLVVRPSGSNTVLVKSNFTGSGPGQNIPWINTSSLSKGINFSGWTYPSATISNGSRYGIDGGTTNNNTFGVNLDAGATRVTLAQAVQYNEYLSCTITPKKGQLLDLRGASVNWGITSADNNSANQCAIMTSLSGFTTNALLSQASLTSYGATNSLSANLPFGTNYASVTNPVEIRIYLWNNIYGQKYSALTSFQLNGAVHSE
jgi:hypothetical protein